MGNAILLEAYYAERHKYLVDSIPTRHSTLCSSTWLIFTSKANTPSPKRRALQSRMKSGPKRQSHELIDIWPSLDPEIHRKTLCPTSKTYSDWTKTGQSKYPRPLHKWEGRNVHSSSEIPAQKLWEDPTPVMGKVPQPALIPRPGSAGLWPLWFLPLPPKMSSLCHYPGTSEVDTENSDILRSWLVYPTCLLLPVGSWRPKN